MKIINYLKIAEDSGKSIIIAIFLVCICLITTLISGLIQSALGMGLLGFSIASITLSTVFVLSGKIIFNVSYSELFNEIRQSKYGCVDKLIITMIFSLIFGFIALLIYQIDFIINPDKTELVSYLIKTSNYDSNIDSTMKMLIRMIIVAVVVASEEVYFRYTSYKIFVKKKQDIKAFIILTSIVFGIYHGYNISRVLATIVMSIFISIIYVKTKSVVYAYISHLLWDYFGFASSAFIQLFINTNVTTNVFISGFAVVTFICILILLSIYSYCKRGYIISLETRNKVFSLKQ